MDVSNDVLIGGVSAVLLLLFITQTIREAFDIPSNLIPITTWLLSICMFMVVIVLPDKVVEGLALATAAAATVSVSVRYVKNGKQDDTERSSTRSLQEQPPGNRGDRDAVWQETTTS